MELAKLKPALSKYIASGHSEDGDGQGAVTLRKCQLGSNCKF